MAALSYDPKELYEYTGNDSNLVMELLGVFQQVYPTSLENIRIAIERQAPQDLALSAHELKGSLLTIGHQPSTEIVKNLERMGTSGVLIGAEALVQELELSVKPIFEYIERSGKPK